MEMKNEELDKADQVEESMQNGWVAEGRHRFRRVPVAEQHYKRDIKVVTRKDLSTDQEDVYGQIKRWFDDENRATEVLRFGGYAGTGKSTLISVLAHEYKDRSIAFCAFTGKATNVLKQKLEAAGVRETPYRPISTVHRLIYQPVFIKGSPVGWKLLEALDYDLIIVDEASMIDGDLFADLRSFDIPILAVGDHGQLTPVGGGAGLMKDPDLTLEKIHRQAEGNPVILLAQYVRESGALPDRYVRDEHVNFLHPNAFPDRMQELYSRPLTPRDISDIGVLCYTNKKRMMANNLIRGIRFKENVTVNTPPREEDQVICLRNAHGLVFNGMRGSIVSSRPESDHFYRTHVIFTEDALEMKGQLCMHQFGREKTISTYEDAKQHMPELRERGWTFSIGLLFDYGYCLTVHKAQGSSFKDTFVLYERPYNITNEEFGRWLYTAVTRSSDKLTVVTR